MAGDRLYFTTPVGFGMIYGMAGKRTKGHKALIGIALLTVVVAGSMVLIPWFQERTLARKIEGALAQGYPFKPDKIVEDLRDQEGENAAPFYDRLRERAVSLTFANRMQGEWMVSAVPGTTFTQAEWQMLEQYLNDYSPILDDLEFGSRLDYCYFDKDWEDVLELRFVELVDVKSMTRQLLARIELSIRRGEYEAVRRDLETIHRYAQHIGSQPTIIAILASMGINWVMATGIVALLEADEQSPELRLILREAVDAMPESWDLTRPLQMGAFEEYWYIENVVAKGRIERLTERVFFSSSQEKSERQIAEEKSLQSTSSVRMLKMAVLDAWAPLLHDYDPGTDGIAVLEEASKRQDESINGSSVVDTYSKINSQSFYGLVEGIKRARARRRTLLAALDVLEYRAGNGSWPSALPQSYTDPFDDQPLRYNLTADGFRVWSVGVDGVDHKGVTRDEDENGYDEVVVFPPVLKPYEEPSPLGSLVQPPPAVRQR